MEELLLGIIHSLDEIRDELRIKNQRLDEINRSLERIYEGM